MKAYFEKYPGLEEYNFYVFLKKEDLKTLESKALTGKIYSYRAVNDFELKVLKKNYPDAECEVNATIKDNGDCLIWMYNQKFNELKEREWIGGRIGSLHKYDILLESKAKGSELETIVNQIDFNINHQELFKRKISS